MDGKRRRDTTSETGVAMGGSRETWYLTLSGVAAGLALAVLLAVVVV